MSRLLDYLTPKIKRLRRDAERGIINQGRRRKTASGITADDGYDWFNYPLTGKAPY